MEIVENTFESLESAYENFAKEAAEYHLKQYKTKLRLETEIILQQEEILQQIQHIKEQTGWRYVILKNVRLTELLRFVSVKFHILGKISRELAFLYKEYGKLEGLRKRLHKTKF